MGPTMTPNASTASRLPMPPSTTAEAAATFCSYVYLACLPSMDSTSLPNDRYTQRHCLMVPRGTDGAFAADSEPWPRSKSPIAAFLASMSCFTLKSTRIKSLPFLVYKKWEAVQEGPRWRSANCGNNLFAQHVRLRSENDP